MQQQVMGGRHGRRLNVISEIQLRQLMHIYMRNNPAKFHPDPIWNDVEP